MKQDRELTLTIDNESNSYLRQHGTDSNGVRWCTIEVANECMARIQQELDAARLEVERLRLALTDIRDCNGWIGTNHKYMKLLAREALAAQQEAG